MSKASSQACELRKMNRSDLSKMLEIERRSFRTPWDEERFLLALDPKGGCQCVVFESAGRLAGYFVIEIHAKSTHILNLAVHPDHRRSGYASRCLAVIDQIAARAMETAKERDSAPLQPLSKPGFTQQASRSSGGGGSSRAAPALEEEPQSPDRRPDGDSHEGEIYLEVEESNLPAQLLYRKMGYRAVKILRNYYPATHEDGYKMVRKIPFPASGSASTASSSGTPSA